MSIVPVDRETLLRNLRKSGLLSKRKLRLVAEKLGHLKSAREIAKALASWKLVTKFQAKMLLLGRKSGFHVGPYRILDELGHGGMGHVYKAMHLTMKRIVALKVLAPQTVATDKAKAMFKREIRAAAQLNHANIVMAYDASMADGQHYLAMEYVDGPNLEQYVAKHGALPVGLACEIVFQAAGGLQHAHEKGVIHRDIKPANLLVQKEPGAATAQVKILDFGLARLRQSDDNARGAASGEPNIVMGTPDFLSPEQTKDLHHADIRSDLYSLGCTFYYLLTGQVPFPGGNVVHKLNRHDREVARPIEELRPEAPKAIVKIVRKLLAKNPDDRFQTPNELMDALAAHAEPGTLDWPTKEEDSSASKTEPGTKVVTAIQEVAILHKPVEASDRDSILEWIDLNRRQSNKFRRAVISSVAAVCAVVGLGATGLATLMQ
jgi:eukaryotic-like serine/threonine-protein kinase